MHFVERLLALVAIVLLSPLLLCLALLVALLSGFPVFFTQSRAGMHGRAFRILKFRTMRTMGRRCTSVTFREDPSITGIGAFLRRTRLDELPQLWNIVRGEMSFVGPRPEVLEWVATYSTEEREVFLHRPGLVDPASLLFRSGQYYLESEDQYARLLRIKIRKQIEYGRRRTLASDLFVVMQTPWTLLRRRATSEELQTYAEIGCPVDKPEVSNSYGSSTRA